MSSRRTDVEIPVPQAIPKLARHFRVIAPDYMGFGKSDHPLDREYTATAHLDNLEELVRQLDLRTSPLRSTTGVVLSVEVCHSGNPDRISRVVVMNTSLPLGIQSEDALWEANSKESAWFGWAARAIQLARSSRPSANGQTLTK